MEGTLTKVGNSAAMTINKAVRTAAGFSIGDKLEMDVPRRGVLVVRTREDTASAQAALARARGHIESNATCWNAWPEGMDADEAIERAKEERFLD